MRVLCLIVGLWLAADATAASVQLAPQGPARAGEPLPLRVAVSVEEEGTWLSVYERPVAERACDPDGMRDAALGGHEDGYVAGANGLESTTYEFSYRWPAAGDYRLCAWIFRPGGSTVAFQAIDLAVSAPPATLAMTVRGTDPQADGFELQVALTGEVEGEHALRALATRAPACPEAFDGAAGVRLRGPGSVGGGFTVTLKRRLDLGAWRVCAYVDGVSTARAEAVLRQRLRPVAVRRPVIGVINPATGMLECFRGVWTAFPKKTSYAVEWRRGGRTVATTRRHRPHGDRPVRCRVTATNAAGSRRATSLPVFP